MGNRLRESASPYLLQHVDNPIDWQPWDEQALQEARERDVPIFLSIGYSACHWCHVMAHESFEDDEVASVINPNFVSIKVDREERPDLDETFMLAVQLATGHGGWPMTLFLTPDLKPFFAATYLPKFARSNVPGIMALAQGVARAWQEERVQVEESAERFAAGLKEALGRQVPARGTGIEMSTIDKAVEVQMQLFDDDYAGFGQAPKFPPHTSIRFLLDYASYRENAPSARPQLLDEAAAMALRTLEQMAYGGIYDHVGGGFHRYAIDQRWFLPHFEKMLYDNALLLELYSIARDISEDPRLRSLFHSRAAGIHRFLLQDLRTHDVFGSALDADSDGEEGAYYVWSTEEVEAVLGNRAGAFIEAYGMERQGNYQDEATGQRTGKNVLFQLDTEAEWAEALAELERARGSRTRPGFDGKAIACWNGLAIRGLLAFGDVEHALRCARRWREVWDARGILPRLLVNGEPQGTGFLDDYAAMALAWLEVANHDPHGEWVEAAENLADTIEVEFADSERGAFFFTGNQGDALFGRFKTANDSPVPSPNALTAELLLKLGRYDSLQRLFGALMGWMEQLPQSTEALYRVAFLTLLAEGSPRLDRPAETDVPEVHAQLVQKEVSPKKGWGTTAVVVQIPDGYHINSREPSATFLEPTTLSLLGGLGEASFPEPDEADRYSGEIMIPIRVRARPKPQEFEAVLTYQLCSAEACYLPREIRLKGHILADEDVRGGASEGD